MGLFKQQEDPDRVASRRRALASATFFVVILVWTFVWNGTGHGILHDVMASGPLGWGFLLLASLSVTKATFIYVAYHLANYLVAAVPAPDRPVTRPDGRKQYSNWGRNQTFVPEVVCHPTNLDELLRDITLHARAGRKIKPAGALHSWSACAVTDSVMLRMTKMTRLLKVDKDRRTIKVEAGMRLYDMYKHLLDADLAVYSLPNVDTITVGGCIANCTHGTNIKCGTSSSMVLEVEMVVFEADSKSGDVARGTSRLVKLRRDDTDERNARWFEAAIASFGSLGVIYSVTFQCRPSYNVMCTEYNMRRDDAIGGIMDMAQKYDTCFMYTDDTGVLQFFVQQELAADLTVPNATTIEDEVVVGIALFCFATTTTAKTYKWLRQSLFKVLKSIAVFLNVQTNETKKMCWIKKWSDAEMQARATAAAARDPWINFEYGVPIERADDVLKEFVKLSKRFRTKWLCAMRPVGADTHGYLSPSKGRKICFFDVPVGADLTKDEWRVYQLEVEKMMLAHGGRPSWARWCFSDAKDMIQNLPEAGKYARCKDEMDPFDVFSNDFSRGIASAAGAKSCEQKE